MITVKCNCCTCPACVKERNSDKVQIEEENDRNFYIREIMSATDYTREELRALSDHELRDLFVNTCIPF